MSETPANPAAAEALGEAVPFTFRGVEYRVPPTTEWDYEALEVFESGKVATFLRMVLGEAEHNRFKATKPKVSDVNEFVAALKGALGIQGN